MNPEKNQKLERARHNKNLTQRELAEKVGVTRLWIHNIESRGGVPSLELAKKLAEVLEVSLDEIV